MSWNRFIACCLWCLLAAVPSAALAWQPLPGTLLTPAGRTVSPTNAHPEYPRPQMVRPDWQTLNGLWDFAVTGPQASPPTNYQGQILVPYPIESGLSGVGRRLWDTNTLWYRRTFRAPETWSGRRVLVHFGAVDWHARVLVNGREAGQHRGGYDPFSLDITSLLKADGGEDEIVVAVQDPTEGEQPRGKQSRNPEGIFYTPSSGIWQTVWLEPVPLVRVQRLRIVPDASGRVRLTATATRMTGLLRLEAIALQEGVPVARAAGVPNSELELEIANPHLWSPNDPFLYDLRIKLYRDEELLDEVESYFGLRSISVRRDRSGAPRLALNGEPLFHLGVLDQGFWPDGLYTAPSDHAWREELHTVKRLGFNTIRKHVKVEPDRWYYWCDRLGVLVWQDMPSGNNLTIPARRQFEIELQRMVDNLVCHPSIVLWVLFNEGWGQYDTARLTSWLRELDPSRLVNSASGWVDKNVGDTIDVHSYPGPEAPGVETSRPAVLGEFGGVALAVTNHLWAARTWGYESVQTTRDLTSRYTELLARMWNLADAAGLSGAIYTQLSDVETECNGLFTYDRAVLKIDAAAALLANQGASRTAPVRLLLSTAEYGRSTWRYTFAQPSPRWTLRRFEMSRWARGRAGFGSGPQQDTRTTWTTPEIWLRRIFVLPEWNGEGAGLLIRHAADATVYVNGILSASVSGESAGYVSVPLPPEAAATLHDGVNVVAVHARRTVPNPFIDVGLAAPLTGKTNSNGKSAIEPQAGDD